MGNITNRQLGEIIGYSADLMQESSKKVAKTATEIEESRKALEVSLEEKIKEIQRMDLKPDLKGLNEFYEGKTAESIKSVNNALKVPKYSMILFISSGVLALVSILVIYFNVQSKTQMKENIIQELKETGYYFEPNDRALYQDMYKYFQSNERAKNDFIKWQDKK